MDDSVDIPALQGESDNPHLEMTQLEITVDAIQRERHNEVESSEPIGDESTLSNSPQPVTFAQRSVSFGPTTYSEPTFPVNRSISFSSYPSTSQDHLGEDEIALLEDVDIEMSIPSRLVSLDFPKADDGHDEDVAKVIRKSFSKLGLRPGAQDAIAALSKSGLSLGHISLMSQVEAAVEGQEPGDLFWEEVCGICLSYYLFVKGGSTMMRNVHDKQLLARKKNTVSDMNNRNASASQVTNRLK